MAGHGALDCSLRSRSWNLFLFPALAESQDGKDQGRLGSLGSYHVRSRRKNHEWRRFNTHHCDKNKVSFHKMYKDLETNIHLQICYKNYTYLPKKNLSFILVVINYW